MAVGAPTSIEKLDVFENVVFWSTFIKTMFYVFDAYVWHVKLRSRVNMLTCSCLVVPWLCSSAVTDSQLQIKEAASFWHAQPKERTGCFTSADQARIIV